MTTIRRERPGDEARIHAVNARAFEREAEAEIVDVLRSTCPEGTSLVAEEDGRVVGHILFTPTAIETEGEPVTGTGLGPLAILPEYQRRGIGSALVVAGLEEMRKAGEPFVVLVGHPTYYPRFGFERGSKYGIRPQFAQVPDEAFMIFIFDEDGMRGVSGVAKIRPEFAAGV